MSEGKPDFRARLSLEIQNSLIGRSTVQPIGQTQAASADAFQPTPASLPLSQPLSQPQPHPQASMQPPVSQLQPMQMQMPMQMPMQQQPSPQQALYAQQRATFYAGGPLYAQQTQSPQYAPMQTMTHRMQTPVGMMQMQTGPASGVVAGAYAMPSQPQPQSQSYAYAPMQMPQMSMQMSSRMMQQPTSLLQASNPQVNIIVHGRYSFHVHIAILICFCKFAILYYTVTQN